MSTAIRYCSIIDKNGKVLAGGMRKGIESLEPRSKEHTLITQLAILMDADKDWDAYLGQTDYFLIRKNKINLLLYPVKGWRGVLVSTEPSFSMEEMVALRRTIDAHEEKKKKKLKD